MSDKPRLDEQVLSEATEMTLSMRLDEVDNIDVDLRTNLLKLIQGQADSVSIAGQGLVMQDIRVQEIEVQARTIAINPLSAIFGEIQLDKPLDATVRLVLTEQDINRALKSDYIRSRLQSLSLNVDGQIVSLEPQQLEVQLLGDDRMGFKVTVLLHEKGEMQRIGFTSVIRLCSQRQIPLLEALHCTEGEGITLEFAIALLNKIKELIDLPYFELEGIVFRVKQLNVQQSNLTLHTEAYIRQIPELNATSPQS